MSFLFKDMFEDMRLKDWLKGHIEFKCKFPSGDLFEPKIKLD